MPIPAQLPFILALLAPFIIRLAYGRRLPHAACWLASFAVSYLLFIAALWLRDAQQVLDSGDLAREAARFSPVKALLIVAAYQLLPAAVFAFMQKWQRR